MKPKRHTVHGNGATPDCELASHALLPKGLNQFVRKHPLGDYEIHLSNLRVAPQAEYSILSAQVYFSSESFESAKRDAEEYLVNFIYLLTFVTNMPIKFLTIRKLADWSLGLSEREALYFLPIEGEDQPFLALNQEIADSVTILERIERTPALNRALRWFSLGVHARYAEEQFTYFWFAIEILAQIDKPVEPVQDKCSICSNPLYCKNCDQSPTHRPYPKQSIEALFSEFVQNNSEGFFGKANEVRNRIMHGDSLEDIEKNLGAKVEDLINGLGKIAWCALYKKLMNRIDGSISKDKISFLIAEKYAHATATLISRIFFSGADPDNPNLSEMPELEIEAHFNSEAERKD